MREAVKALKREKAYPHSEAYRPLMRVLRDFLVLTAVAALVVGHLYVAVAELPLDLHDWSTMCSVLVCIEVSASGQPSWGEFELPYGLDAFRSFAREEGRVLRIVVFIEDGIYLLLRGREVLDAMMRMDVDLQPDWDICVKELSANLERAFSSVERSGLSLRARGLKGLRELEEQASVEVVLDLGLMRELLASYSRLSRIYVDIHIALFFLTKARMEALRPRGIATSTIGCLLLAFGLARPGRRKPLSARDAILLLASLALLAAGDILLHLAWYRLANLCAHDEVLAPPPLLSPGPWNEYYNWRVPITRQPARPEVRAASRLAAMSWLMILAGLVVLAWLANKSGLLPRPVEVELWASRKLP